MSIKWLITNVECVNYLVLLLFISCRSYTIVANVMESPTRWLHGFMFRHEFEIIRDSQYKSCSRDYFYICRQEINVRKCSINANCAIKLMAIYWKMRSHANSAHPPNSHLAPKLKINTAHWNNSLHIGGTWYGPSDPHTSSVCIRL